MSDVFDTATEVFDAVATGGLSELLPGDLGPTSAFEQFTPIGQSLASVFDTGTGGFESLPRVSGDQGLWDPRGALVLASTSPGAGSVGPAITPGQMFARIPPLVLQGLNILRQRLQSRISVPAALALASKIGVPGLVALGLSIPMIAALFAYGSKKKRRRARGISARDMRITRRTTRKLINFRHQMVQLCSGVGRGTAHRGRPGTGRAIEVVRAG